MKIPNPWPRVTLRVTSKPGDVITVLCTRGELEIDDSACEALIEPIKDRGRGNYDVLCQGKIWSKQWGLLELEDHMKKVDLENQEAKLKERQKKDAEKRVRDAKERGEAKAKAREQAKEKVKIVANDPSEEEKSDSKSIDEVLTKVDADDKGKELKL